MRKTAYSKIMREKVILLNQLLCLICNDNLTPVSINKVIDKMVANMESYMEPKLEEEKM